MRTTDASTARSVEMKAQTFAQAKPEAIQISRANPGKYITVVSAFGAFAGISNRLHVFAPSDSCVGWYVLNGEVKSFTEAQIIADQNATPALH